MQPDNTKLIRLSVIPEDRSSASPSLVIRRPCSVVTNVIIECEVFVNFVYEGVCLLSISLEERGVFAHGLDICCCGDRLEQCCTCYGRGRASSSWWSSSSWCWQSSSCSSS